MKLTKEQLENLKTLNTTSDIELAIKDDLLELSENDLGLSTLLSELKDDPDNFTYDEDDLEQFIAKYL